VILCPTCQAAAAVAVECDRCVRRRRYGAIVQAMFAEMDDDELVEEMLAGFDALAELMIDRHRVDRAHQRELREEQRYAQRNARAAHDDGVDEGRRDGRDW